MLHEKAAAHDEIIGAVEFEQKGRTGVDGFEMGVASGLPEVNFVGAEVGKVVEPVVIGDGEVEFHFNLNVFQYTFISKEQEPIISNLPVITQILFSKFIILFIEM